MRSLGLDVGDKRTGVAISDPQGILATPLTVLASEDEDNLINEILNLVEQYKAECIVVGQPRQLNGELGKQADKVTAFANKLSWRAKQSDLNQLDIQLWDERLSTKAAERLKMDAGSKGRKLRSRATCPPARRTTLAGEPRLSPAKARRAGGRRERGAKYHSFSAKAELDAIAAAVILQGFLDSRRPENSEEP